MLHLHLVSLEVTIFVRLEFKTTHPLYLYSNDPLWDGDGCTAPNPCCSFNNPPWFYKQLPQPTTDNIEMRVCKEDVAIEIVEIYIH